MSNQLEVSEGRDSCPIDETPWAVQGRACPLPHFVITNADGRTILAGPFSHEDLPMRIVAAVNSHDALKAEVERLREALAGVAAWAEHKLGTLQHRPTTRSNSPVGEGYTYVEIPEWAMRRLTDDARAALDPKERG